MCWGWGGGGVTDAHTSLTKTLHLYFVKVDSASQTRSTHEFSKVIEPIHQSRKVAGDSTLINVTVIITKHSQFVLPFMHGAVAHGSVICRCSRNVTRLLSFSTTSIPKIIKKRFCLRVMFSAFSAIVIACTGRFNTIKLNKKCPD